MPNNIEIIKKSYFKDRYTKVIDTEFKQLIKTEPEIEAPSFSIDDFFQLYEDLFFQIPKEGDINSHRYLLQKEADYLGVNINEEDIQALLDEITSLRQELLTTQQTINDLTKKNG